MLFFKKILFLACCTLFIPLAAEEKILAFAGSTRANSYNKKLVQEAAEIARKTGAKVTVIDLKDYPIPFYDEDLEAKQGMPPNAKRLRDLMMKSTAMIISTPEYNGSLPAVLKNALDWTSRGEDGRPSRAAFQGKKVAIMSASPGRGGGSRALMHLRGIVEDIGGEVIQQQISVANAHTVFNEKGLVENSVLKKQIKTEVQQLLPENMLCEN